MKKTLLIGLSIVLALTAKSQISTNGLAAFYSFNDSTTNDQYSDNHGVNNGATFAEDRFGNPNSAVYFNGGSYIDCGDSVEFDLTYQAGITISAWTKQSSFAGTGNYKAIVTKWNMNSTVEQYGLWGNSDDHLVAFGQIASGGYTVTNNITANHWHHLVLTYDTLSGIAKFYLNGQFVNSSNIGVFPGSNGTNNLSIGAQKANLNGSTGTLSRYFFGYIDDVRIYGRAIDSSEVISLYNEPNPMFDFADLQGSASSPICSGDDAIINLPNSESDVNYFLLDGGSIVDGPVAGNGTTINMNGGSLTSANTYTIHATHNNIMDYDVDGISFDGTDDYITSPLNGTFRYDTAYSFETWVKVPHPGSSNKWPTIFSIYNADSTDIEIYVQDGTNDLIVVHNRNKTTGFGGTGYVDPPNDDWFHLAVTFDGTNLTVYYNGEVQSISQSINPIMPATQSDSAEMAIGYINSSAFPWNSRYNGKLDNMRVWRTVRTQNEIIDNMYKCLSGSETGLIRLFKFDDGMGSAIASDYSTNSADGTLNNMDVNEAWIPGTALCGIDLTSSIIVDVEDCGTSIESSLNDDIFKIYPNPSTNFINIKSAFSIDNATLLDITGAEVIKTTGNQLNISSLNSGTYFLRVSSNGIIYTAKVVKQ